jgi:hypothetical protein
MYKCDYPGKCESEDKQIAYVKLDASNIEHIAHPTETVQLVAVLGNPRAIGHIDSIDQHYSAQLMAITIDPECIQYINRMECSSFELMNGYNKRIMSLELTAVNSDPDVVRFIHSTHYDCSVDLHNYHIWRAAIVRKPSAVEHLRCYSCGDSSYRYYKKIVYLALTIDPGALRYVIKPTMCMRLYSFGQKVARALSLVKSKFTI